MNTIFEIVERVQYEEDSKIAHASCLVIARVFADLAVKERGFNSRIVIIEYLVDEYVTAERHVVAVYDRLGNKLEAINW